MNAKEPEVKKLPKDAAVHNYEDVVKYLENYKKRYSFFRDAWNIHAVHLRNRQNLISIPLLVVTTATGVIASINTIPQAVGIIVGAASAVLTAIQRYCAYAERSENARMTAKSYSKILNKIENMKLSMTGTLSQEMFSKFLREIQSLSNSTREMAVEIPWEVLKYINTLDAEVCCVPVMGRKPKDTKETKEVQTEEPEEAV